MQLSLSNTALQILKKVAFLIILFTLNFSCDKRNLEEAEIDNNHELAENHSRFTSKVVFQRDESQLMTTPAFKTVTKALAPNHIPYKRISSFNLNVGDVYEIDSVKLERIQPGKNGIPEPWVYSLPAPSYQTFNEQRISKNYKLYNRDTIFAPVLSAVELPEPKPTGYLQMRDNAVENIQVLNLEQGLPNPVVNKIISDKRGNLWMAMYGALSKFDGTFISTFSGKENYNVDHGPITLAEDSEGNIWIGHSWGLTKFDGKQFTVFFVHGYSAGTIHSILESQKGELWFGTSNGLLKMEGNSVTQFTKDQGLSDNYVLSLMEDQTGNLWIGTEDGLTKYNGEFFTRFGSHNGLIHPKVYAIHEDSQQELWVGTDRGLCRFDGIKFYHFSGTELSNKSFTDIIQDSSGTLWLGTRNNGLFKLKGNTVFHYTTREGMGHNQIYSICEDQSGNIWVSTNGGGLTRIKSNSFTYHPYLESDMMGRVSSIAEDQNMNLWFAVQGEGLIKYQDKSYQTFQEKHGLRNDFIYDLLVDNIGQLWFSARDGGLYNFNGSDFTTFQESENEESNSNRDSNSVIMDDSGKLWLASRGGGLKCFDGYGYTRIEFEAITAKWIPDVEMDSKGNIWSIKIGLRGGLYKYDGKKETQWMFEKGTSFNNFTTLFNGSGDNMWIGTTTEGIFRYNGDTFLNFSEENGLINNHVKSVAEDLEGRIWVGTKAGLSVLTPIGDAVYTVLNFGREDGLKDLFFNKAAVILDSRNRLWWGTDDVITQLDLDQFQVKREKPELQLCNVRLGHSHADLGLLAQSNSYSNFSISNTLPFFNTPENLKLNRNQDHISFSFAAIEWSSPGKLKYSFRLKGLDNEWSVPEKLNHAEYRNLPPGKYQFQVKCVGRTGIWSETINYPFRIHRPWWATWWSIAMYGILFLLLLRYYIRFTLSKERLKAEMDLKQVEVQKMQEIDQLKNRFFANISHEFRTPLTLLLGPINDLLKKQSYNTSDQNNLLMLMKRNALRLQQLINQLLDLSNMQSGKLQLHVSKGDLHEYIRTLIHSFLSYAESRKIHLEYELMESTHVLYFDRDKLNKILSNLISNALKFTPQGGKVNIRLLYEKREDSELELYAKISVTDTGEGIDEENIDRIFERFYQVRQGNSQKDYSSGIGLALTRELVELYRGQIHVESQPQKGSVFTVEIPVSACLFNEDEIMDDPIISKQTGSIREHQFAYESYPDENSKGSKSQAELPVVLIVEDNPDLRKYISVNLEENYLIWTADNGQEGIALATDQIPDLVISDLMMPVMDGIELCKKLKSDRRTSHIPLIMLTAKADKTSRLASLERGADDYILKPFDAEELKSRVRNLIEQRKKLRERYREEFLDLNIDSDPETSKDFFLESVIDCINRHISDSGFNVVQLSEEMGLSRTQMFRKIKAVTDFGPSDLIRNTRLKKAAALFREGHTNVSSVLYSVGFNSSSNFASHFRELFGKNPKDFIKDYSQTKHKV